jgi:hypothetical protein
VNTNQGKGQSADVQMPFTAHLEELRSRLVKSCVAVGVAFIGAFAVVEKIFSVLAAPLRHLPIHGLSLIGTGVTEAFFTKMKVAFVAARGSLSRRGCMSMKNAILGALFFSVLFSFSQVRSSATPWSCSLDSIFSCADTRRSAFNP